MGDTDNTTGGYEARGVFGESQVFMVALMQECKKFKISGGWLLPAQVPGLREVGRGHGGTGRSWWQELGLQLCVRG